MRRQGRGVFVLVSLTEPAVAAAALLLLRPYPWAWVAAASLAGLRAAVRFIRPGARHVRGPRWAETGLQSPQEEPATSLLIEAVWRRTSPKAADAELRQALDVARRNRVEGCLARAYPAQLADVLEEARAADKLFALHVGQVTGCLRHAGIPAVLIPAGTPGDHIGASIEMVVSERDWRPALTVLAGWYQHRSTHQLGNSATAVLYLAAGLELRLHTSASWFGVPFISTDRLLSRARRNSAGLLVPAPADYLRIWLAQAQFQDLVLDLSALLTVRSQLRPGVVMNARSEARREGWHPGFAAALAVAEAAIDRLDRGLPVSLPVPLPISPVLAGPPVLGGPPERAPAMRRPAASTRDQYRRTVEAR